jgi:hypothetical protein
LRNPPMLEELRGVRAKDRVSLRLVISQNVIPMSRRAADRPQRRLRIVSGTLPDDLYDYIPQDDIETPAPRIGRPLKHDVETWTVTDDWPERVPVMDAEIDLFEAWFGDIFDELFGPSK